MNKAIKTKRYEIIGACMNVHSELGSGFLESVYQEALAVELTLLGIPFKQEVHLNVLYKGEPLKKFFIADFICYDNVIVELKAIQRLESIHKAQVINYLQVTNLDFGLLVNFGSPSLQHEKVDNLLKKSTC